MSLVNYTVHVFKWCTLFRLLITKNLNPLNGFLKCILIIQYCCSIQLISIKNGNKSILADLKHICISELLKHILALIPYEIISKIEPYSLKISNEL